MDKLTTSIKKDSSTLYCPTCPYALFNECHTIKECDKGQIYCHRKPAP
ncbi:MAG: hypothetical protein H8D87_04715 [Deltaproteobacteria bacterium]|nr:hypothetical protein [Candidatus Desulfobacula maris]MBL6995891.1 hypothetical protein [Desulfobacula sp.]